MHHHSTYGMIVPQQLYTSGIPFSPQPIVKFYQDGHEGIYLVDALHQRTNGIYQGDVRPVLTTTSSRVTLRLHVSSFFTQSLVYILISAWQWVGYRPYPIPVNAREHSTSAESIPVWKLAYCIANGVREFYRVRIDHSSANISMTSYFLDRDHRGS